MSSEVLSFCRCYQSEDVDYVANPRYVPQKQFIRLVAEMEDISQHHVKEQMAVSSRPLYLAACQKDTAQVLAIEGATGHVMGWRAVE